jgi:hypothetical protein
MKNLLMISYPFPPNASAGAVRSERFARYLPQFGWAVDVVTIRPRKDMFEDRARLDSIEENVCVHFTQNLDPWLWLRKMNSKDLVLRYVRSALMRLFSFPDHMLLWVPFALRKAFEICKRKKIDVIYTTSPPHSTHIAGLLLSKWLRKPWVADFRDPWTLNAYREESLIDTLLLKAEKIMEKSVLRNASVILANTRANQKNLLMAFSFLDEKKVIHLPNGWEEFPSEVYRAEKKEGPLTIVHAGTFYPKFKPYGLLYALAAWHDGKRPPGIPPLKKDDIKIVLLGSRDEETARIISELNISEFVEIRPWVALDEARRIMCQADLLWASLGTGKESSTFIPSKLFEYIAAKRPILGFFPEGEAERFIKQTGTGLVFTDNESSVVIRSIYETMCAKGTREPSWFKPDHKVINVYHITNVTVRLSLILENALQSHRAL